MKTVIIYYSYEGHTALAAETIRAAKGNAAELKQKVAEWVKTLGV